MVDRHIVFNGINSKDLGLKLTGYSVSSPSKKKITVDIPYRNGSVDVSSIYSDYALYEEREITARFYIVSKNKAKLKADFSKILNSYVDIQGKKELKFYDQLGYIYEAEIVDSFDFDEFVNTSEVEIRFIAYPLKKGIDYEGSRKLWNTFNFEEDVLQNTIYEIEEKTTISIINPSRVVIPEIIVEKGAVVIKTKDYISPKLDIGQHIDYNFTLKSGITTIELEPEGKTKIEILFRKESL